MASVLSEAMREKIKLRATFFNGLSIGVMLIGTFTPLTRAIYDPSIRGDALLLVGATALVCFAVGFAVHIYATRYLEGLEP